MSMAKKDVGELLVASGAISAEQLAEAREVQRSAPGDIGRIIVDLGFADDKSVTKARAESMNLPFVDLATQKIDPAAANAISEKLAKKYFQ